MINGDNPVPIPAPQQKSLPHPALAFSLSLQVFTFPAPHHKGTKGVCTIYGMDTIGVNLCLHSLCINRGSTVFQSIDRYLYNSFCWNIMYTLDWAGNVFCISARTVKHSSKRLFHKGHRWDENTCCCAQATAWKRMERKEVLWVAECNLSDLELMRKFYEKTKMDYSA